jgi:rod shape-determining protein MreC
MLTGRPRTPWLSYILLLLALAAGLILAQLGYLQPVRDAARTLFAPLQIVMSNITIGVGRSAVSLRDVQLLRQRADELRAEVNRLSVENARMVEIEQENLRLRQLLNFTRNNPLYDYRTGAVVGQKIGEDTSNLLFAIFVDVGARDGVAPGMPVVTDRGLVGRVTRVGPNVAEVIPLIDPASVVSARVLNSRVTGIVRGSVDAGLVMERIPQGETLSPGDIVVTSGLGGTYPDKLVIGQVTEVSRRDADMFQTARIRPTVDFGRLETVLVITTFEPLDTEASLMPAPGEEQTNQ